MKDEMKSLVSFYKSIVDQECSPIVICNLEHQIIYMNPNAVENYVNRGGDKLLGKNIFNCHNQKSAEKMQQIVDWFAADENHNIVFLHHDDMKNKDLYMVALRDEGKLIGYYEKHEYRNAEIMKAYDL